MRMDVVQAVHLRIDPKQIERLAPRLDGVNNRSGFSDNQGERTDVGPQVYDHVARPWSVSWHRRQEMVYGQLISQNVLVRDTFAVDHGKPGDFGQIQVVRLALTEDFAGERRQCLFHEELGP